MGWLFEQADQCEVSSQLQTAEKCACRAAGGARKNECFRPSNMTIESLQLKAHAIF